jgi:hypothetical protein
VAGERRQEVVKESVSLDVKRAFPFRLYGRRRPGRTAASTAVPGVLLTRKRSQVQTLSRPPRFSLVKDLSAPSGQRSSCAAAALRPQAAPHRSGWAVRSWTTWAKPSPNDHAGWSPPPGPGPWSTTTPMTCPGRPAGAGEHLLHPALPHHPAGTPPWTSARVGPAARRRRSRDATQAAALGEGRPSCEPARPTPHHPLPSGRCRQATTPPADHGGTSTHCAQPEGGPPHRATPGPARCGHRGGSAADTEGLSVRTPECSGRLDTGRLDTGRPLDRLDGRPHHGTGDADRATSGLASVRTSSRPATTRWAARPHPVTAPGGAWPPRTTLR